MLAVCSVIMILDSLCEPNVDGYLDAYGNNDDCDDHDTEVDGVYFCNANDGVVSSC